MHPNLPEVAPPCVPEFDSHSLAEVSVSSGGGMTLWSLGGDVRTAGATCPSSRVCIEPDRPVIIGRQEGGEIEYLDPRYRPTQMTPSGTRVVTALYGDRNYSVSRGHFMLCASPLGILFVNGVPRRGGGIRPPLNGTTLLEPTQRSFEPGEEYLIERGSQITIVLPNHTQVVIAAT